MRTQLLITPSFFCWTFLSSVAVAQSAATPQQHVLRVLATSLVQDMRSGVLNSSVPGPKAAAWIITVTGVATAEAANFRTTILGATRGRASTALDSIAETLAVERICVLGDSAIVYVDRGQLYCERGTPSGVGMSFRYTLRRNASGWRVRHRKAETVYDPPPVLHEPSNNRACARAFAR